MNKILICLTSLLFTTIVHARLQTGIYKGIDLENRECELHIEEIKEINNKLFVVAVPDLSEWKASFVEVKRTNKEVILKFEEEFEIKDKIELRLNTNEEPLSYILKQYNGDRRINYNECKNLILIK